MNRDDPKPNFISICFHFEDKSRPDVQSSTYAELGISSLCDGRDFQMITRYPFSSVFLLTELHFLWQKLCSKQKKKYFQLFRIQKDTIRKLLSTTSRKSPK